MRLLLDSHALLWWLDEDPSLSGEAYGAIADAANSVFVSAASVWEISIKKTTGKLEAPDQLVERLTGERFQPLAVTAEHGEAAGALPLHHRDPFDRILVAQAQLEGLTIVTRDPRFELYSVAVLPA